MSNLKQYLSPTAQHLIEALVESASAKGLAEEFYSRADINALVNKFDADKAALEAYVLRFERKVRRLKNELRENHRSQESYPSPHTMAGYLAGIIETYLKQERTNEDRETAIAKIIERRLPGRNLKQIQPNVSTKDFELARSGGLPKNPLDPKDNG